MDESRRTSEHPAPDPLTPEVYETRMAQDHSRLIPDLHEDRYSVQDIANLLGMNPEVIQHAVRTGELKADMMGHDIVCIHRADLLAWLNARGPGV